MASQSLGLPSSPAPAAQPTKTTLLNFPGTKTPVDPAKADSYSVAEIRSLIAYINSVDASAGLGSPNDWPGNIAQGESQHTSRLFIIQQFYALHGMPTPSNPAYPHPDPGEAQAGLGPTGIGFNLITSPLDFLNHLWQAISSKEFWLRALEVTLGVGLVLAGLAKLSGTADTVIKAIPVAGKVLR